MPPLCLVGVAFFFFFQLSNSNKLACVHSCIKPPSRLCYAHSSAIPKGKKCRGSSLLYHSYSVFNIQEDLHIFISHFLPKHNLLLANRKRNLIAFWTTHIHRQNKNGQHGRVYWQANPLTKGWQKCWFQKWLRAFFSKGNQRKVSYQQWWIARGGEANASSFLECEKRVGDMVLSVNAGTHFGIWGASTDTLGITCLFVCPCLLLQRLESLLSRP